MTTISNNREVRAYAFDTGRGSLSIESEWPGVEITIRGLTASDLRVIGNACIGAAEILEAGSGAVVRAPAEAA